MSAAGAGGRSRTCSVRDVRFTIGCDSPCPPLRHGPPTTGTTGFEPAASHLTSERSARLSYVPSSAGGIRTRSSELMRLARCHFLHRAGLPGWSRTSVLRLPGPAGWPSPLQAGVTCGRSDHERRQQDSNLRGGEPPYALARRRLANSAMPPGTLTRAGLSISRDREIDALARAQD